MSTHFVAPVQTRSSIFYRNYIDVSKCETAKQVKDLALPWEPATYPLYANIDGLQVESELARSLRRDDTLAELAVVGADYVPVQNDLLLEQAANVGLPFSRVSQWNNGQHVEVALQANTVMVAGEPHRFSVSITDSKGGGSYEIALLIENLVCMNGAVRMVRAHSWKTRHTKNVAVRLRAEHAKSWIDVPARINDAAKAIERLAHRKLRAEDTKKIIAAMFPQSEEGATMADYKRATLDRINAFMHRLETNPDGHANTGTLYELWQATTGHIDHDANATPLSLRRGTEAKRKADALEVIQQMAADDSRVIVQSFAPASAPTSATPLLDAILG